MPKETQIVHDWSTGSLKVYKIEVETIELTEPPTDNENDNSEPA